MRGIILVVWIIAGVVGAGLQDGDQGDRNGMQQAGEADYIVSDKLMTGAEPSSSFMNMIVKSSGPIIGTGMPMMTIAENRSAAELQESDWQKEQAPLDGTGARTASESQAGEHTSATMQSELGLSSVNGITLYDLPEDVIALLGEPVSKEQDDVWSDLVLYQYPQMEIAYSGQYLQYVSIDAEGALEIEDQPVDISEADLKAALGEPDFEAEDGIVFQRGDALLKLFLDEQSREPLSVSYYHIATI